MEVLDACKAGDLKIMEARAVKIAKPDFNEVSFNELYLEDVNSDFYIDSMRKSRYSSIPAGCNNVDYKITSEEDVKIAGFKLVKALVESGADINADSPAIYNILTGACHQQNFELVKYLVENGADVNKESCGTQYTPLSMAIKEGNLEIVKYLIEHGADVNAKVTIGKNALDWAIMTRHTEIVKYLTEKS